MPSYSFCSLTPFSSGSGMTNWDCRVWSKLVIKWLKYSAFLSELGRLHILSTQGSCWVCLKEKFVLWAGNLYQEVHTLLTLLVTDASGVTSRSLEEWTEWFIHTKASNLLYPVHHIPLYMYTVVQGQHVNYTYVIVRQQLMTYHCCVSTKWSAELDRLKV